MTSGAAEAVALIGMVVVVACLCLILANLRVVVTSERNLISFTL